MVLINGKQGEGGDVEEEGQRPRICSLQMPVPPSLSLESLRAGRSHSGSIPSAHFSLEIRGQVYLFAKAEYGLPNKDVLALPRRISVSFTNIKAPPAHMMWGSFFPISQKGKQNQFT